MSTNLNYPTLSLESLIKILAQLPTVAPASSIKTQLWNNNGVPTIIPALTLKQYALNNISVNIQGFEGGSTYPGTVGTDYFAPTANDYNYILNRTNGPIRIPFSWERLQPTLNGALDATYLGLLKTAADMALAANATIILDCHNYMRRQILSGAYAGSYRAVDNPDGVLTRLHLVDLWTKLTSYFKDHAGVSGWDLMNEPTSDNNFGATGNNATDLPVIMQAVVNAINAVETVKKIYIEGNAYSSAASWTGANPNYPLTDAYNRIIYSAHCYPDYDASGTHFAYADMISHNVAQTILVDRSTNFVNWCATKNVRGHIGETNVGVDDARWLTVLDNGLTYWKNNNISVNLWLYGANFGNNPYNLYPYSGAQSPQWAVVQKATGVGSTVVSLVGPNNGPSQSASSIFSLNVNGYLSANKTYTFSDANAGGTFNPSSLTVSAGFNPPTATFTYTAPSANVFSISAKEGANVSNVINYSTNVSNAITALGMVANNKYSDWSQSNGSLTPNSTYANDETGANTAARLSDNSSVAAHIFNSPTFNVVPNCTFEVSMNAMPSGAKNVQLKLQGNTSSVAVNVDLVNNKINSGLINGGGVLSDAVVTTLTNGYKTVRFKGTLASIDLTANLLVSILNDSFSVVYSGNGSDVYFGSYYVYFAPVHTIAGAPIANAKPTISVTAGNPGVGGTYTMAAPTYVNGTPTSYSYRWLRDGTTAISGATNISYTAVSADNTHTLVGELTATNANGSAVSLTASVSINVTYTVAANNLVTSQTLSDASWTKSSGTGDTLTVTPNYKSGGFAPDGMSYPTRIQWQSQNYSTSLQFNLANHAAGYQSVFIRTNPASGDAPVYVNLRSNTNGDFNLNIDNSSGTNNFATGKWNFASGNIAANEPFLLLARPTSTVMDFLIWGERAEANATASAIPYANVPTN